MSDDAAVDGGAGRIQLIKTPDFALGDLQVRPSAREVIGPQGRELLEPRVMQVLVALARAEGAVVSRDALIESCWDGRIVGEDAIHRCIVRLRKLSDTSGAFAIETVPRIGYRITGVGHAQRRARARPRRLILWVAAILVVMVAGSLAWRLWPQPAGLRVAVLAFDSPAGDTPARSLAAGLPDAIVASLTERQAPTVSRGAATGPRHGGARLLASGAVARAGPNMTVRLRLDDARTGLTLWSASMQRPAAEAAALQDQAAARLADNVDRARRAFGPRAARIDGPTLAAYLRVMDIIRLGSSHAAEVLEAERDLIARAPDFSPAHSALACDLAHALKKEPPAIAANWRAQAIAEARRALALDARNGEAYICLYFLEPERARARREALLLDGLAHDPQNSNMLNFEARTLRATGRVAAALPMHQQALMLDPLSPTKTGDVIGGLAALGRTGETAALAERGWTLWPDNPFLRGVILYTALLYAPPDRAEAALTTFQRGEPRLEPALEAAWRSYVEDRRTGRVRPATASALAAAAPPTWTGGGEVVVALAQMGEVDAAFDLADHLAAADPERVDVPVLFDPAAAGLRRDPRFMRLAARLGLVDYWRASGRWADFCASVPYDCRSAAVRPAS